MTLDKWIKRTEREYQRSESDRGSVGAMDASQWPEVRDDLTDLVKALKGLLDWEQALGGWEAPCWDHARIVAATFKDESQIL